MCHSLKSVNDNTTVMSEEEQQEMSVQGSFPQRDLSLIQYQTETEQLLKTIENSLKNKTVLDLETGELRRKGADKGILPDTIVDLIMFKLRLIFNKNTIFTLLRVYNIPDITNGLINSMDYYLLEKKHQHNLSHTETSMILEPLHFAIFSHLSRATNMKTFSDLNKFSSVHENINRSDIPQKKQGLLDSIPFFGGGNKG